MLSPNVFDHIHSYPRMRETCGLHIGSVWNMNTGGLYPSPDSYNEDIDTFYAERSIRTFKGCTYENKIICGHFYKLFTLIYTVSFFMKVTLNSKQHSDKANISSFRVYLYNIFAFWMKSHKYNTFSVLLYFSTGFLMSVLCRVHN